MSRFENPLQLRHEFENADLRPFESLVHEEQQKELEAYFHLSAEFSELEAAVEHAEATVLDSVGEMRVARRLGGRHIPMRVPEKTSEIEGGTAPAELQKRISIADTRNSLAAERLTKIRTKLEELLARPGFAEAFEAQYKIERMFVPELVNAIKEHSFRIEELEYQIFEKRREVARAGAHAPLFRLELQNLERELKGIRETVDNLKNPETFGPRLLRVLELGEYQDAYKKGRLIEVPSVKNTVDEVLANMRSGQPYLLAGHLGSGKTEMARHAAKLYMLENASRYVANPDVMDADELYNKLEPEFFSASDEASVYDLVGKLKLTGKSISDSDLLAVHAKTLAAQLKEKGIENVPEQEIVKILLGQGSVTETMFNYGPLGRALRDKKPLIIDEINMAPPEVMSRINDFLLRRKGDKIRLQENGEEVFEFDVPIIATLNIGSKYGGVKEFNAAFRSRWVGKEVEYPSLSETYDLILVALMRQDVQRLPPSFPIEMYEKLVDLTVVVHESQELFTGKTRGQRFMNKAQGMSAESSQLDKMVISTRDLMRKIVGVWLESDFSKSLDSIIATNILQGGFDALDDQKFMTELFIRRGFFKGWTAGDFARYGVKSVSQEEIAILQVSQAEITAADSYAGAIASARAAGDKERRSLVRGNAALVSQFLE